MPRTHSKAKKFFQDTPVVEDDSQLTDDDLIAENFKTEDLIKAAQQKFEEWAKPHKERLKAIEDTLFARLVERKADSTKTDSGTAYISQLANTKIEDREALFDFIAEHWDECGNDMLKLGVSIDPIRNYMQSHDGALPPGVSISHYNRLNIRRS